MLHILKEIVQDGFINQWPTDGEDLLLLARAVGYFRQNALWAAVQVLDEMDNWHSATTRVLARYVPESTLLNAAAELYQNTFGGSNRVLLLLGAVLGPAALSVPQYYATVPRFLTRVVGLRYEDRQKELAAVQPGIPVNLLREPENRHDQCRCRRRAVG